MKLIKISSNPSQDLDQFIIDAGMQETREYFDVEDKVVMIRNSAEKLFLFDLGDKKALYYTITAHDGLRLLNRVELAFSAMTDGPFYRVIEPSMTLQRYPVEYPNEEYRRKPAPFHRDWRSKYAEWGWLMTTDYQLSQNTIDNYIEYYKTQHV